jgi:hypothetical protein
VVACARPPATVPPESLPYDPGFVASTHKLEVTLARNGLVLDTQPIVTTCDVPDPKRNCARCEVATMLHEIDPGIIDGMAIAFARYPKRVLDAARIERVALCRVITYDSGDHGPAGLADPATHRVFISVDHIMRGRGAMLGIEETVHHEVFHLLDFFALLGPRVYTDVEWLALNPRGTTYEDDAINTPRPAGFVNSYARTDQMEDRASTFQLLMSHPDELCALAADDPALARKVRLVWQRIARVEGAERLGITARCARTAPAKAKAKTKTKRTKKPATSGTKLRLQRLPPSASP